MTAPLLEGRAEPAPLASAALSAAVHVVIFAMLFVGVRWQNPPPEPWTVELWEAPRPSPDFAPAPALPAPEPKPEPRVEKPDIELKAAPKPEPPKAKPKPEPPKVAPKPLAPKAVPQAVADAEVQRRLGEELAREQQALALERERAALREAIARETAAARARALEAWIERVRAKIRGNILLPPDLKGNPEAIFDVVQLPTGEVLSVRLRKSSGHPGYDQAVERAILKSSPLPQPERAELFQRELELRFRPLER